MLPSIQKKLQNRKEEENLRFLTLHKELTDFCSNDYLGLSKSIQLRQDIECEYNALTDELGNGSTGSRLISGNTRVAMELEQELAIQFDGRSALLFSSGYMANVGVLSSIPQKGDTVLYDELCHASLKDGIRLSMAERFSFRHNDPEDLRKKILKAKGSVFIVVESIYSMDGDEAPLEAFIKISKEFGAYIIVDEAHSTGIYGNGGSGLCCAKGVEQDIFLRVHTFGKAIGAEGACIVAQEDVKDFLINFCRPFIYTTAPAIHSLITIRTSLKYVSPLLQQSLFEKVRYFKEKSKHLNFIQSDSPIQALLVSGNDNAKTLSQHLGQEGFFVKPILSPTVKSGAERLRICLHSFNESSDIDKLVSQISASSGQYE